MCNLDGSKDEHQKLNPYGKKDAKRCSFSRGSKVLTNMYREVAKQLKIDFRSSPGRDKIISTLTKVVSKVYKERSDEYAATIPERN